MPTTLTRGALRLAAASCLALALAMPAAAVDTTDDPTPDIAEAQAHIAAEKWDDAIGVLQLIIADKPNDADVNNLLGYSLRKSGKWKDALGYYLKALEIDPNHLGANEYLGELYVEQGEMEKANERLAVLETACGVTCEQYLDLKAAIDGKN